MPPRQPTDKERNIRARNRANAKKSTGPRTATGAPATRSSLGSRGTPPDPVVRVVFRALARACAVGRAGRGGFARRGRAQSSSRSWA